MRVKFQGQFHIVGMWYPLRHLYLALTLWKRLPKAHMRSPLLPLPGQPGRTAWDDQGSPKSATRFLYYALMYGIQQVVFCPPGRRQNTEHGQA